MNLSFFHRPSRYINHEINSIYKEAPLKIALGISRCVRNRDVTPRTENTEKAKVWPPVREAILHFLKTGKNPRETRTDWPLPDTGLGKSISLRGENPPLAAVLIEIAIHEKRVDDVLKWYDVHKQKQRGWVWDNLEDEVALAIAHEYPDKAVDIWKRIAESHISRVNVAAYAEGAAYLRKAQKILLHLGRADEWDTYQQRLKEENRRRPRLIEILDSLSQKPIIRGKC